MVIDTYVLLAYATIWTIFYWFLSQYISSLSRDKWVEYSKAKDEMLSYTDTKISPWYVVDTDDKRKARLMTIMHILETIPYKDVAPEPMDLPPRKKQKGYVRPPMQEQTFVRDYYNDTKK